MNFISTLLLLSLLSPEMYASFSFGLLTSVYFPQFFSLGFSKVVVRFAAPPSSSSEGWSRLRSYLLQRRLQLTFSASLALYFLFVLSLPIHRRADLLAPLGLGVIVGLGGMMTNCTQALLQAEERFATIVVVTISNGVLVVAGVVTLTLFGVNSYIWPLILYAVANLLALAPRWRHLIHDLVTPTGVIETPAAVRDFRFWATFSSIAYVVAARFDFFALTFWSPLATVGLYAAAIQLTQPAQVLGQSLVTIWYPEFVRQRNSAQRLQALAWACSFAIVALGGYALAVLMAAPMVPLVFSSAYAGAVGLLRILVFVPLFDALATLLGAYCLATDRPRAQTYALGAQAVAVVVLTVFCLPRFGAIGVAYTTVGSMASCAIALGILVYRERNHLPFGPIAEGTSRAYANSVR